MSSWTQEVWARRAGAQNWRFSIRVFAEVFRKLGHELEFKTGGFLIESLQLKLGKLGLARWISWISEPEIL